MILSSLSGEIWFLQPPFATCLFSILFIPVALSQSAFRGMLLTGPVSSVSCSAHRAAKLTLCCKKASVAQMSDQAYWSQMLCDNTSTLRSQCVPAANHNIADICECFFPDKQNTEHHYILVH